jgi:hypothetical protein
LDVYGAEVNDVSVTGLGVRRLVNRANLLEADTMFNPLSVASAESIHAGRMRELAISHHPQ